MSVYEYFSRNYSFWLINYLNGNDWVDSKTTNDIGNLIWDTTGGTNEIVNPNTTIIVSDRTLFPDVVQMPPLDRPLFLMEQEDEEISEEQEYKEVPEPEKPSNTRKRKLILD